MSKEEINKITKWLVVFLLVTVALWLFHSIPSDSLFIRDWRTSTKLLFSVIDGIMFFVCLFSYISESEIFR